MMNVKLYSPADYEFSWRNNGEYRWNSKIAHKLAKLERDYALKQFIKEGVVVTPFVKTGQEALLGQKFVRDGMPVVNVTCNIYGIKFLV
jgi:hypothetical protein